MTNEIKLYEAIHKVLNIKECDDYIEMEDFLDDLTEAFWILYREVYCNER